MSNWASILAGAGAGVTAAGRDMTMQELQMKRSTHYQKQLIDYKHQKATELKQMDIDAGNAQAESLRELLQGRSGEGAESGGATAQEVVKLFDGEAFSDKTRSEVTGYISGGGSVTKLAEELARDISSAHSGDPDMPKSGEIKSQIVTKLNKVTLDEVTKIGKLKNERDIRQAYANLIGTTEGKVERLLQAMEDFDPRKIQAKLRSLAIAEVLEKYNMLGEPGKVGGDRGEDTPAAEGEDERGLLDSSPTPKATEAAPSEEPAPSAADEAQAAHREAAQDTPNAALSPGRQKGQFRRSGPGPGLTNQQSIGGPNKGKRSIFDYITAGPTYGPGNRVRP